MARGLLDSNACRRATAGRVVAWVSLLIGGGWSMMADAIEEPPYTVVGRYENFEIRDYAPYLVAEVVLPGPADQAGNRGFRILAGYIFGQNKGARRLPMAAPVAEMNAAGAAASAPAKIRMTAPVIQAGTGDAYAVQFTMPREYSLDTLPEPTDARVKLRAVPRRRYAVIRYSGTWTDRNYRAHLEQLERGVAAAGLKTTGNPVYARYNPPFVPWFMRRNEIWLELQ